MDYASGWGPVTFLLVAAGLAISGGSVAAVSYANAMVASVTGLWSVWLAAGRCRNAMAVAFPCFVALLAAAPFALGEAPIWTSHGMVYNRYGYALLSILMLECFLPPFDDSGAQRREWLEPVLTGCALGLLLFLKVSYFLVGLPLIGASFLFQRQRARRALALTVGFAATALIFLAYLRFDALVMWNDLSAAAAARSGTLGVRRQFGGLVFGGAGRLALLGLATYRRGWRYVLVAALVVGADSLLLITNAQLSSYPLTAAFAMLCLVAWAGEWSSSPKLTWVLFLVLAVPFGLMQAAGLGYGVFESKFNPNPPGVLRFESERLRPLILYDVAPDDVDRFSNGREYVASIDDGLRLLTAHTKPNDKVANLDMFNPFAYALGREPIRGGIAAAAYRYTLDDRHHPSAERFFADAAVVMEPKYPASPPIFNDGYRRIYEPELMTEFRLEAESSRWRLYRRIGSVR